MGSKASLMRAVNRARGPGWGWNTGTAALPVAAALAQERGFLEPGHRVGLLGIGSGLNCIMLGVDW